MLTWDSGLSMIERMENSKSKSFTPVASREWLAGINESETKAWDNLRVKEEALQRAAEELREATREWAREYAIMREAVKQQMPDSKAEL